MKKILFTCFVWLFACNVFAQTVNVDSLVNVLETKNLTAQEQMEIYKKLCFEYEHKNIDKFGQYAEKGFLIANNENEKVYISDFHRYMGISCEHYGHTDSAMMYYKKGLKLAVETTNKECEAILYTKLSNLHTNKRQYKDNDLAWEYLMEALQIAEKIENKEIYVLVLLSIGNYHGVVRNTERAGDYVERAKAVAEKINYDYGKIVCYYTLGDFYHACSKDDKAMEYVLKSLELSMKIGNKSGEIASLQILTYICCLGTGELTKAEKYATKCLMEAEKFGDQGLLIGAYTVLSYVYVYQKRYDECKEAVFKAWNIDSLNIHLSTLGNLAAAYMFSGDLDKAYSFFVNYIYFLEDYTNSQFQQAIADMDIKYETEKKEIRIAALEEERKLYIWLGIAGVAILLLAIGLFLFRQRLNRQKIKQLEQEQQLIATQSVLDGEAAERSRLARDLHDGLGGMLSVVKLNLKDMKHFGVMDGGDIERFDKALDMLDQSIGELRRVAHHIMPESLMRYGLKVSLEDFCHAIPGAHFQYLGEDPRLDTRLEILIYRCAYELVNNAVKHAHATNINVQLMIDSGVVSLTVHDDGIGFDPQTVNMGIGLENIRSRIAMYNGKMTIHSAPDTGTEISIEIE